MVFVVATTGRGWDVVLGAGLFLMGVSMHSEEAVGSNVGGMVAEGQGSCPPQG